MYRRIVASKVRGVFDRISRGDTEAMVKTLAPEFTYYFYGDHALGGERHTAEAMRRWWARIRRIMPNGSFRAEKVLVSGPPWATDVAVFLRISAPLPDGTQYNNVAGQFIKMRWGRVTEIHTIEHTQELVRALKVVAAAGATEAVAPPITDENPPDSQTASEGQAAPESGTPHGSPETDRAVRRLS
jgi:ketosteroid isomerase-like protein